MKQMAIVLVLTAGLVVLGRVSSIGFHSLQACADADDGGDGGDDDGDDSDSGT